MELFKVICVTCHAKLSVRNESLIGQIVGCPRCGSMVEVAPPTTASTPLTTSNESTINLSAQPDVKTGSEPAVSAATEETTLAEANAALQASVSVARYKLIVWSVASFLIGAALVTGILIRREDSNSAVAETSPPKVEPTTEHLTEQSQSVVKEEKVSAAPLQTELAPLDAPTEMTVLEVDKSPELEAELLVDTKADDALVPSQPKQANSELVEIPEQLEASSSQVVQDLDLLEVDPESLSLATVAQPTANVTSEVELSETPAVISEEVPSTLPPVRLSPASGEASRTRDAAQQLLQEIPGARFDRIRLVDLLKLLSNLSGVPVSIEPDQLLMSGITANQEVSLSLEGVSLGEVLEKVGEPLKLEYVTRNEQVIIRRQQANKHREIDYPIDDLVTATTDAQNLVAWIEQVVSPSTWENAGGVGTILPTSGSLRIGQSQNVQYQTLIFLERMRLGRGLSPRSRYPIELLAPTSANQSITGKLDRSATFTFVQFTNLHDVFGYWQNELAVPLLIDWPALAEMELWPETQIKCAIHNQPWNVALENILEPLGLGWRATLGNAIEITTAKKVRNELQLDLYELRRELSGDANELIAQLRSLTTQPDNQAGGLLLHDPVGNTIIALQPAAMHKKIYRQLHTNKLLRAE